MDVLKDVRHHLGLDQNFSILLGNRISSQYLNLLNLKTLDDENTVKREWCESLFRERIKRLVIQNKYFLLQRNSSRSPNDSVSVDRSVLVK